MSMQLSNPFIDSVKKILLEMAGIEVAVTGAIGSDNDAVASYGVTSMVSCAGKIKGRLMLDMEQSLAVAIAQNITGIYYTSAKEYMVLASVSEVNNIIAGDAITAINNRFGLGLRLAPPIVLSGKDVVVSIPRLSSSSLDCKTKYGKLKINVAFERSL